MSAIRQLMTEFNCRSIHYRIALHL